MKLLRPSLIYKYKPVSNEKELGHIQNIIVDKKIYCPLVSQLNDPMEANAIKLYASIMGNGYRSQAGKSDVVVEGVKEKYGVLSFSSIPNSPIMWAHYGKDYTGCCLIFKSGGFLSNIEPVIYSKIMFEHEIENLRGEDIDSYAVESLLFKDTDWAYENEWRLIIERNNEIISFDADILKGVIVGEKMHEDMQKRIASLCSGEGIPCFKTYVMCANRSIGFIPLDYESDFVTYFEITEHMNSKSAHGMCIGEEFSLFENLNKESHWE